MMGLDTNVIVPFLMKDDGDQAASATKVFAEFSSAAPRFVCREVMVELVWVLQKTYCLPRTDIADAIEGLLGAREIVVESADQVAVAVDRLRKGSAGFAEQMIVLAGQRAGCQATVTFDRKAAGLPGMSLLGAVSDHLSEGYRLISRARECQLSVPISTVTIRRTYRAQWHLERGA